MYAGIFCVQDIPYCVSTVNVYCMDTSAVIDLLEK